MLKDDILEQTRTIYWTAVAFLVVSCITVTLRIYVRASLLHCFGADDAALLLALVRRLLSFSNLLESLTIPKDPLCRGLFISHGLCRPARVVLQW